MNLTLRKDADAIIASSLNAVLPDEAVRRALKAFAPKGGRVLLVAAGKAAWQMAHAAVEALGRVDGGVVVTKYEHVKGEILGVNCYEAGHPVPDENSFAATEKALELVQGLTGKTSVKDLTHSEALEVLTELRRRSAPAAPKKKRARKYDETPGGVSAAQQKKVWYLMFQLEKFDPAPEGVQLRDRLCGLISKQFKVTSFPAQPFRFLTFEQGGVLIEGLKSLTQRKELEYLHSARYHREQEAASNAE